MVDANLLKSLLLQLASRIQTLKGTKISKIETLEKDPILQNAVLHLLQTAVEICLDMANHLIADEKWRPPTSNRDAFQVLFEQGILSGDLLKRCQKMAGFRNILVHMYEKIDLADVYAILKKHLKDFDLFATAIKKYLKKRV